MCIVTFLASLPNDPSPLIDVPVFQYKMGLYLKCGVLMLLEKIFARRKDLVQESIANS